MAFNLSSISRGETALPPRITLYGVAGIGKSTLAAQAPAPIFIQTEDGLTSPRLANASRFPLARTYEEVLEAITALAQEAHQFQTLVIDSVDWLEPLIWNYTARLHNEKSIESFGYGKGYVEALSVWADLINALNYLRAEKQMTVILLGHVEVRRYDDPTSEAYDRYQIKLHKTSLAKVKEWSDAVLFANYKLVTKSADQGGFGKKRTRAIGQGERCIFTTERPAFLAKNRYDMDDELPMDWDSIAQFIPFFPSTAIPSTAIPTIHAPTNTEEGTE